MHGLFTTKETGRKNIVHKLNDMTQQQNHCISCRVSNTTSNSHEWNEGGQLNRKAGLVIGVSQVTPKLNELHLLFTSTKLSFLRRLKYIKTV